MGRFLGCVVMLGLAGCALDRSGQVGEGGAGQAASSGEGGAPATDGPGPSSVSASSASGPTASVSTSASASSSGGSGAGGSVGSSASSTDASSAVGSSSGSGGADPVCGNDQKEEGEDCDDGDTTPGDRCDATCHEEHPDTCPGTAIPLAAGTFVITDTTVGANDTIQDTQSEGDCFNIQVGPDVIYAVTAGVEGSLRVNLDTEYQGALLLLLSSCPADVEDCSYSEFDDATLDDHVEAGETVYIVVDSYRDDAGSFTLTLELEAD